MRQSIHKVVTLFLFCGLMIFSCQKSLVEPDVERDLARTAMLAFKKDSLLFFPQSKKTSHNVRQELERSILWNDMRLGKDSALFFPVRLVIPRGTRIVASDHIPLNGNVWLYAHRENGEWKFDMWTLIPERKSSSARFSGTLLSEDYFDGDVGYTYFREGQVLADRSAVLSLNKLALRGMVQASSLGYECNTRTYMVCVGDPSGSGNPEICNVRYATTCKWVREDPGLGDNDEVIDWIDCDPLLGGCGPGGGAPPDTTKMPKVVFCDGYSQADIDIFIESFEAMYERSCLDKYVLGQLKAIDSSYPIRICPSNTNQNSYSALTKQIKFYSPYNALSQLDHELFHMYQDLVAYPGGIGGYSQGNPGSSNIEFEQVVYQDIIRGSYVTGPQQMIAGADPDFEAEYNNWIISLTNAGQVYPNLNNPAVYQAFEQQFFSFLARFAQHSTHYQGVVLPALKPLGLKKALSITQKNCND